MDARSLAAVAIVAAVAGAGMYFMNAAHERQIADLRKQVAGAEAAGKRAEQALVELEKARKAEADARRLADIAKQKELAAERARLEAEAKRTAEVAAQRQAEAKRTADEAKRLQERAAADRAAAERARAEGLGGQALYEQALALEQEGKGPEAVKLYVRAARSGSGKAALRLGEIYDKGIPGVPRDYAESLKWYNAARVLGQDVRLSTPEERAKAAAERAAAERAARERALAEERARRENESKEPRFYREPYRVPSPGR